MEVTLTWDEAKLGGLVAEAQAARRRVRNVAWAMIVVGLLSSSLVRDLGREHETAAAPTTRGPSTWPSGTAPYVPAPPSPPPQRHGASYGGFFVAMFWLGIGLLSWSSIRRVAWVALLLGSLVGVVGLVMIVVAALGLDPSVTWDALPLYVSLVLLGAVQFHCSLVLRRGSTIFACDYVRGEVTDWSVVLGLLSAEGPDYQRLREQVGLK